VLAVKIPLVYIAQRNLYWVISMKRRLPRGFTLIELMVTVAIIAIIAAVALPSYQSQVRKSRRADAVAATANVQQAQERWRADHTSYTATLSDLGWTAAPDTFYYSDGGYYKITVPSASATGYTVRATAVSGKSQASDTVGGTSCTSLTVTVSNGNATPTPALCWSR
jgi:type IV pilus assembly protein PilE